MVGQPVAVDLGVLLLVAAVAVAVLGAVAGVLTVTRVRRKYAASNEVVPGRKTSAPAAWAGAHTPEALLHRRLRDAVASVRSIPDDGSALAEARAALEQQALAVDDSLVALAAVPERMRTPLTAVSAAVSAVEAAAVAIAERRVDLVSESGRLDRALADMVEQAALLEAARAEVETLDGATQRAAEPSPSPDDHSDP